MSRLLVALLLVAAACSTNQDTTELAPATATTPTPAVDEPAGSPTATPPDAPVETPDPEAEPAPTADLPPDPAAWQLLEPAVVATYPHDPDAFTQGLVLEDGRLFESTGLRGSSTLREVDLTTGAVERSIDIDDGFFGEGLELVDGRLIQLTWQSQTALVHDRDSFELVATFEYPTEGWGLCLDGDRLVMSDGSSELVFRDPETFEAIGSVVVTLDGQEMTRLNELECVDGDVWANVWLTDTIIRIHADTGIVTGVVDASALEPDRPDNTNAVLNGIAHDDETGRFLLTGKLWPTLYEVDLVEVPRS